MSLASRIGTPALGLALVASSAQAAAETRHLPWDPPLDVTILVEAGAAWAASEALKPHLAPSTCRWCDVDGFDWRVRNALVWRDPTAADTASGVIAFGLAPLSAALTLGLAADHDEVFRRYFLADLVMVGEATALAMNLDQLTKFLVGRERPFVYVLPPSQKGLTAHPDDNDLSFFSGHTTWTFALAAAAGTVATMRGYRWAPLTWIAGGALALLTGYLRMAADKHWFTDVATGMGVGTATGILVPYAFHAPRFAADTAPCPCMRISPMRGGASLSFVW